MQRGEADQELLCIASEKGFPSPPEGCIGVGIGPGINLIASGMYPAIVIERSPQEGDGSYYGHFKVCFHYS